MRGSFLLAGLIFLTPALVASQASPGVRYRSATIDQRGELVIVSRQGRAIRVPKRGKQTSFGSPELSADSTAVAVPALFANCCTSYDIPLELVVYAAGRTHRFTGDGLPIFQWGFVDGGRRVAFGQEPVHFGCEIHYELHDVASEKLVDSADVPEPCGQRPDPVIGELPAWVAGLRAGKAEPDSSDPTVPKTMALLTGTVRDDRGNVIAGAAVVLVSVRVGTVTDAQGRYTLLTPGTPDSLRVSAAGWATATGALPRLQLGTRTELSVRLKRPTRVPVIRGAAPLAPRTGSQ
ncbi:MAG: carboxypeptidase-like regulatory domain-containing protein [Gemmatimonadota bacterium]